MAEGIVGEFFALKEATQADLLAMQMGDFYEFFGEDAEIVGETLDLKVSKRSSGGEQYSMAGVPIAELAPYLNALVERGFRVAVADQQPEGDGFVRRIDRVVTPGTLVDPTGASARYLATALQDGEEVGLAFLDVTTGEFQMAALTGPDAPEQALTELYRFTPTELLPGPALREDESFLRAVRDRIDPTITEFDVEAFAPGRARHTLREQFGEAIEEIQPAADPQTGEVAGRAAGAALDYLERTGVGVLASVTRLGAYDPETQVTMDATTQRNLELVETMTGGGQSVLETVDHTRTAAGARLLRAWLTRPLQRRGELDRRQRAIDALSAEALARDRVRELLGEAADLERIASKAVNETADAAVLVRCQETLALLPALVSALDTERLQQSPARALLTELDHERAAALAETLETALVEDPPATVREGGLLRPAYDAELAELIEQHEEAVGWLEGLAEREQEATGIGRLSVDRNTTDGYYIQISKRQTDDVPAHYEGIKTLKNAERYVTPALREREREILRLEEARNELEYELFTELRAQVAQAAALLQTIGRAVAELDTLCGLATHAVEQNWVRPTLSTDERLQIEAGRHPVVEQTVEFVPNDLSVATGAGDERRFLLVTGPNMSGKSTYMRQAALIVLLAQIGSFVPARAAVVGMVDGIYTRVGALDELAQGRSTFMVEMQELSNILHDATEDSLVILDEVGRGTATYDGISIAWAATEYLHNQVGAKTLFATHYHELTALAAELPRVQNVHVAAEEQGDSVTFLRSVVEGATDRSYGIHVAELAGVPDPVTMRASEVLERLRDEQAIEAKGSGDQGQPTRSVQAVFDLGGGGVEKREERSARPDPAVEAVLDELQGLDVAETRPVELLGQVEEWQRRLEEER
jgi:DNA mismatch repair protein MutS